MILISTIALQEKNTIKPTKTYALSDSISPLLCASLKVFNQSLHVRNVTQQSGRCCCRAWLTFLWARSDVCLLSGLMLITSLSSRMSRAGWNLITFFPGSITVLWIKSAELMNSKTIHTLTLFLIHTLSHTLSHTFPLTLSCSLSLWWKVVSPPLI